MENNIITIFTDGSSRGNPGPGGWGAVVVAGERVYELGGREAETTNNRMEMTAVLEALKLIETRKIDGDIEIHTDSAYVLQGATMWVHGWQKNGWKTKTGDDVLNQDIWKEIAALMFRLKSKRSVQFTKVSGHSGHRANDRCDEIATQFADQARPILFTGSLTDYEKLLGGSLHETVAENATKPGKSSSSKTAYSYVSEVDGAVVAHKTWKECEARVRGKKARFKKVFSKQEEDELVRQWST